jgi:hypothetical protein
MDVGGMSPGTQLNRYMEGMGFPDKLSDLYGAALDKAIGNDMGVARNMFDFFSPLSTSQLDKMMGGGFAGPGFCPRPHDNYGHNWGVSKHTHYDREKINVYKEPNLAGMFGKKDVMIDGKKIDVGNDWGVTPKQLESKILTDPNFRAKIESQVGGRIVLDGNADGNITIAKKVPHPMMPFQNHVHNHVGNMLGRLMGGIGGMLGGPMGGMIPGMPGGMPGMPGGMPGMPGGLGGPMGQVLNQLANFLGGLGGQQQAGQGGPGQAGGAGGAQGSPSADTQELQNILKNPNLSFEAKLALFTGKFIEKKQKEMEEKMNQMTAAQDQGKAGEAGGAGEGGKAGGGGGGFLGGILGGGGGGGLLGGILGGGGGGGMLGGLLGGGGGGGGLLGGILGGGGLGGILQMGGGLIGGMYGGPIGASLGSSIGGAVGSAAGGGGGQAGQAGQAGGAGAGKGSQSASEQKLQTELTAITQAFNRMVEAMNNCMKTVSDMGLSSARLIR